MLDSLFHVYHDRLYVTDDWPPAIAVEDDELVMLEAGYFDEVSDFAKLELTDGQLKVRVHNGGAIYRRGKRAHGRTVFKLERGLRV